MLRLTDQAAKERFGDRLLIGSIGMIQEGESKFRLMHDGAHGTLINAKIHTRDQLTSPMVNDLAAEMNAIIENPEPHCSLIWDFESAHRLVPVDPVDWGLQSFTRANLAFMDPHPEMEILINTLGTFGFSTAGYWWGRLGAMALRALHYALGPALKIRLLLFADDGKATFRCPNFVRS